MFGAGTTMSTAAEDADIIDEVIFLRHFSIKTLVEIQRYENKAVGGNWLQAASYKLQALMGAYYRLSAFIGIKEGRKCKVSCLKKYLVAVNALSAINKTQIFMIFRIYHDRS